MPELLPGTIRAAADERDVLREPTEHPVLSLFPE